MNKTYENIRKNVADQEDDFTTGCLLGYSYFKAFANHLSVDIKLSKTQLSNMIQSGRFLGKLLGPLLKTGLPLIKNVIKPLAKGYFNFIRVNCSSSSRCRNA